MRIAQLAPLSESVPPEGYGGTELVVSLLTEGLVEIGHEVTLFASGDSRTKAKLISVIPQSLRTGTKTPVRRWPAYNIRSILELQNREEEFDVVHNHMGYEALPFLKQLNCKTVTTHHNIIKDYCAPIYLAFKDLPCVAISDSYRKLNYPEQLNYVGTIYNGIDLDLYPYNPTNKRSYLLFLGRVSHDKGTFEAIEIAQSLKLPLIIAGKVDETDRQYFIEKIEPRLKAGEVDYIGEVGSDEKIKLYGNAIAVLYPITFDEPFGLVMVESLASGTPIVGFGRGSVTEVVVDKKTGIIGNTTEELIKRFDEIKQISSQACRERVIQLFSNKRMVTEYEALYKKLCR